MPIKKSLLLLGAAVTLSLGMTAAAEEPRLFSDGACADAVDFAMRTAEHRDAGKTRAEISQSIHESIAVFKQQYPDLEEHDMQTLLVQVYEQRWTRFVAAKATARDCARRLKPVGPLALRDGAAMPPAHA